MLWLCVQESVDIEVEEEAELLDAAPTMLMALPKHSIHVLPPSCLASDRLLILV
jgi:hypothetical protein